MASRSRRLPLLLAAVLATAACGAPAGADGDLVNGWAMLPAARYVAPAAGQCLAAGPFSAFEQPSAAVLAGIDCAEQHSVEVVATGTVAADTLPAWDSDPVRAAYAACDRAASDYAGGDWHTGRLLPFLSLPSGPAWAGGVRTWVCGLAEAADDLFAPKPRTGSLRGGLKDPRPLALSCAALDGGDLTPDGFYRSVDAVTPVSCTDPHDTEFVGVWAAPAGAFPADAQALNATVSKACFAEVASFLGLSALQLYQRKDVYTFWDGLTRSQWQLGDRTAHCFLNVSTAKILHSSLKGLGTDPLPA
ncbi:septum formation family protein [Dactylosporangium sp. CA-052675]|uniref:septum formation family protein n=1 Tax=Dactylosporangium sp. CA-052675 TaxID=3239927 RepID=UPI003D8AA3A2